MGFCALEKYYDRNKKLFSNLVVAPRRPFLPGGEISWRDRGASKPSLCGAWPGPILQVREIAFKEIFPLMAGVRDALTIVSTALESEAMCL